MPKTRICKHCGVEKSLDDFVKNSYYKYQRTYMCYECRRKYDNSRKQERLDYYNANKEAILKNKRGYYRANIDRLKESNNRWYQENKEEVSIKNKKDRKQNKLKTKAKNLKRNYGLSLKEHQKMYVAQDGRCGICCKPVPYDKIHTDHNHETEAVRGLLCHRCNVLIGYLETSAEILGNAERYLEHYGTRLG